MLLNWHCVILHVYFGSLLRNYLTTCYVFDVPHAVKPMSCVTICPHSFIEVLGSCASSHRHITSMRLTRSKLRFDLQKSTPACSEVDGPRRYVRPNPQKEPSIWYKPQYLLSENFDRTAVTKGKSNYFSCSNPNYRQGNHSYIN